MVKAPVLCKSRIYTRCWSGREVRYRGVNAMILSLRKILFQSRDLRKSLILQ